MCALCDVCNITHLLHITPNYPTQLPSMMTGGALWFPNLTVADPYYILPAIMAATMYVGAEAMLADSMPGADEKQKATSRIAMRVFSVIAPVLTCTLPSGLQLYFLASTVVTIAQAKLLFNPVGNHVAAWWMSTHVHTQPHETTGCAGRVAVASPQRRDRGTTYTATARQQHGFDGWQVRAGI